MPKPSDMTDAQLIERILEDKETHQIAEALGLEPQDYAARVLHYIRNPKAEPQLQFMDAQQEKEAGMPSLADTIAFMEQVAEGEEHERTAFTGFDDDEKSAATVTGAKPKRNVGAPPMPGETTGARPAPPKK